jgi:prepilin-type processing-associated H-X9-DG protein
MAVSTDEEGSLEYVQSGFDSGPVFYTAFRTFQALAGELDKPQTLICPDDIARAAAANFVELQNSNVSYFVGVDSTFDKPASILAGDRNLATNEFQNPTILRAGPGNRLYWTLEMHQYRGNVLFADGHVEEWNNPRMAGAEGALPGDEYLFLPSVEAAPNTAAAWNGNYSSGSSPAGSSGYSSGSSDSGYSTAPAQTMTPTYASQSTPMSRSSGINNQAHPKSSPSIKSQESSTASEGNSETPGNVVGAVVTTENVEEGMSQSDRHMMKILQHTFEWLYLLLLLLLLLYVTYKIRKWMRERETGQGAGWRRR